MRTQCDRIQAVIVAFQPVMKDQSFTAQLADSFFEARIDSVVDVLYGEPSASIAIANMAEVEIALDLSEAGIVSSRV